MKFRVGGPKEQPQRTWCSAGPVAVLPCSTPDQTPPHLPAGRHQRHLIVVGTYASPGKFARSLMRDRSSAPASWRDRLRTRRSRTTRRLTRTSAFTAAPRGRPARTAWPAPHRRRPGTLCPAPACQPSPFATLARRNPSASFGRHESNRIGGDIRDYTGRPLECCVLWKRRIPERHDADRR